jgi:predicted aldo/keto reductase-like oxidoreductase
MTEPRETSIAPFLRCPVAAFGKPVCRLGLASRGQTSLTADDVRYALSRGVNFLNWPGVADTPGGPDAVSEVVSSLGAGRDSVVVCVQFGARTADEAEEELRSVLEGLHSDYVDVLTLYYVEQLEEWEQLTAPGGVVDYLRAAKKDGVVRRIGLTSHQRPLAARMAQSGLLDVLMIRYNAAHRGAERDIFPVTDPVGVPVIAYTATRWGALMEPTPDDPPGFVPPAAPAWYRFALQAPSVAVALTAPTTRAELEAALSVLQATGPLDAAEYEALRAHGDRVRRHAGTFW